MEYTLCADAFLALPVRRLNSKPAVAFVQRYICIRGGH